MIAYLTLSLNIPFTVIILNMNIQIIYQPKMLKMKQLNDFNHGTQQINLATKILIYQ